MNLRAFAILTTAASLLPMALAVNKNNSIRGASSFLSSTLSNDVTPRQQGLRQLASPCQCRPDRGKFCCENGMTCTSSGCVKEESPPPPPPSPPGTCPSCIASDLCFTCDWSTSTLECGNYTPSPTSVLTGYKSSTTINGKTVSIETPLSEYACNDGTGGYYKGGTCQGGGSSNVFGAKCCPSGQVYAGILLNCIPMACDENVTPGECLDGGGGPTGVITPQPTSTPTQAVVTGQPTSAPTQPVLTPQPTSAPTQPVVTGQPTSAPTQPVLTPQPTSAPTQPVLTPQPTSAPTQAVVACAGAGGLCKGKGALSCCSGFTCNGDKVCESISSDESLPWTP